MEAQPPDFLKVPLDAQRSLHGEETCSMPGCGRLSCFLVRLEAAGPGGWPDGNRAVRISPRSSRNWRGRRGSSGNDGRVWSCTRCPMGWSLRSARSRCHTGVSMAASGHCPSARRFRYWPGNAGRDQKGRHGIPAWLVLPQHRIGTRDHDRSGAMARDLGRQSAARPDRGRGRIDFLLPVARWTDWGPDTAFHRSALDPLVWASGLLAHTSRLRVFSTVHTAFHHPVVAAKQLATADHLSKGRVGLNIVAGWHAPNTRCSASRCRTTTTRATRSRRSGGTSSSASGRPTSRSTMRAVLPVAACRGAAQAVQRAQPAGHQRGVVQARALVRCAQRRSRVHCCGRARGRCGNREGHPCGGRVPWADGRCLHARPCRVPSDQGRGRGVPALLRQRARRLARRRRSDATAGAARAVVHSGDAPDIPGQVRGRSR